MRFYLFSLLMVMPLHAVRWIHLRHHAHPLDEHDVEGMCASMTWWQAILVGPVFSCRMIVTAWFAAKHGTRRWIAAEIAGIVAVIGLAAFVDWPVVRYQLIVMTLGNCLTGFVAVWMVHRGCDAAHLFARSQRSWIINVLTLNNFFHLEHHLFPAVASCNLPELARRLDRVLPTAALVVGLSNASQCGSFSRRVMPTLVLSTLSLPASSALAGAARALKWDVSIFDQNPNHKPKGKVTFYGGTDLALAVASRLHLALLEPPFDLLAKLPLEFTLRRIEYSRFGDLVRLNAPTFVKPADALNKVFDAGIYSSARDIRAPKGVSATTPVLLSEPIEWSAEYRCFIKEGEVVAWSPYMSFGRPSWKAFGKGTLASEVPANLKSFCKRLFSHSGVSFPPGFVMDIGLIEQRGWGVVEFNPVWCSGVLGADPQKVLAVLEGACRGAESVSVGDQRWVVRRPAQVG